MPRQRPVLLLVVVASVVLAGCAGGDDAGTTTGNVTGTDGTGGDGPSAQAVREDTLAAMADVESYRVDATTRVEVGSGAVTQQVTRNVTGAFDRADREFRTDVRASGPGGTSSSSTYLVGETVYVRSEAFVRTYGTQWIKRNASENFTRTWRLQDVMTRQRAALANASTVSLSGVETVNGTETYVLRASMTPEAYKSYALGLFGLGGDVGANLTVHRANFTYWVDTDTYRPVRSVAQLNVTVEAVGSTRRQNTTIRVDYWGYGEVGSITLPADADDAVNVSNHSVRRSVHADPGRGETLAPDRAATPAVTGAVPERPLAAAGGVAP